MRDAFWETPGRMSDWARSLVQRATAKELSITFELSGVLCKARLDLVGADYIADLNTTRVGDGCARWFELNAFRRGYFRQAGFYLQAKRMDQEVDAFYFVVIESEPPFLVNVIAVDPKSAALGLGTQIMHIEKFKECMEAGAWPGYCAEEVPVISTPDWAAEKLEARIGRFLSSEGA